MIEPDDVKRYRRELTAMVAAAADDPESFATVADLIDATEKSLTLAVHKLRAQGYSYADIGRAIGVSKQAVQQRYRTPAG